MTDLERVMWEAWERVWPKLKGDADELKARLGRRRSRMYLRPLRAFCLAVRVEEEFSGVRVRGSENGTESTGTKGRRGPRRIQLQRGGRGETKGETWAGRPCHEEKGLTSLVTRQVES